VRALWLATLALALGASLAAGGERLPALAVAGDDRAVVLVPAGASVVDYANGGYELRVRDGVAEVRVDTAPLASRVAYPGPPRPTSGDEIGGLAYGLAAGAQTRYEAVSRLLSWVARNVEYDPDRHRSQRAAEVLRERTGYCTGVARLTVALLRSAGLEAREVAGYVFPQGSGVGEYHRWVEVDYGDRGWLFSDPLRSHHFVPATYLRLASETGAAERGLQGLLLERQDRIVPVDVFPGAPAGVRVRRNDARQLAATLRVQAGESGTLRLAGGGIESERDLSSAAAVFVGLAPGVYRLSWRVAGEVLAAKRIVFRGPVQAELQLAEETAVRERGGGR